jgi:hypothetical protein
VAVVHIGGEGMRLIVGLVMLAIPLLVFLVTMGPTAVEY